ncbi:MAG: hypothetical protein ABIP48_24910 [Planctomycetota bacterium]
MPIQFFCPLGHRLRAPRRKAGWEIRCPACDHRVIVPEVDGDGLRSKANNSKPPLLEMSDGGAEGTAEAQPGPPPLPEADRRESIGSPRAQQAGNGEARSARGQVRDEPAASEPLQPLPRGWLRRRARLIPANCYRPDRGKIQSLRWLAFFLAVVVAFSTFPAWDHLNLATAPDWARIVLLLAALEGFYILWMLATPDWASVWVVTLVFAFVAAVYAMATAIVVATPLGRPMPLDIGELHSLAPRWCASVLLLTALATYLSGHTTAKWRRSVELGTTGRRRQPQAAS